MAGRTPQTTAAAPAPSTTSSESVAVVATGTDNPITTPPAPEVKAPKAKDKPAKKLTPPTPENAAPTVDQTNADFEAGVRAFEEGREKEVKEGKSADKKEKAASLKDADQEPVDDIQKELDAEEAKEKAKVAKDEPEKEEAKAETAKDEVEDVEPPDPESEADEYEKWINSLSKPAKKRIEQYRKQLATTKQAAAERIVLQPTLQAPLSHISNMEQLDAEKAYWTDIRNQIRSGDVVKIRGVDGKKVELDPSVEEDLKTLQGYQQWAEAALDAVPDAKDRIKERVNNKAWEKGEKLAPGLVSDKESFAHKKALEFLRKVPQIQQLPDYEIYLAHMARSMKMEEDAKPTEGYPKGKAMWKEIKLDKEGNAIGLKKAEPKEVRKQPPTDTTSKPGSMEKGNVVNIKAQLEKAEKSLDPDDFLAAVRAKLA